MTLQMAGGRRDVVSWAVSVNYCLPGIAFAFQKLSAREHDCALTTIYALAMAFSDNSHIAKPAKTTTTTTTTTQGLT